LAVPLFDDVALPDADAGALLVVVRPDAAVPPCTTAGGSAVDVVPDRDPS
jgi:hypothetical protein